MLLGLLITFCVGTARLNVTATAGNGYEEVKDWPKLPPGVQLGECAGVAVDINGHVMIFHRPGRGFDTAATELLKDPAVLEVDADSGKLISSWGAHEFLVPHGITVDPENNVFLTDVSLQQVFKFTHDGRPGSRSSPAAPISWWPTARTRECSYSTRTARSRCSGSV